MKRHKKISRRFIRTHLLVVLFSLILIIPLFNILFSIVDDVEDSENRAKQTLPVFNPAKLDIFPSQFETYFDDNFILRNLILQEYNRFVNFSLHFSAIPEKAFIGKNGFLFYSSYELENYRGDSLFTPEELNEFVAELKYRDSIVKANNAIYYFVLIPSKHSVYPENLPDFASKLVDQNNSELLMDELHAQTNIRAIYLRNYLVSKKNDELLYLKTDNHWNELGAFYAIQRLTEYMRLDFPQMKPLELSDFEISYQYRKGGNLAEMLGLADDKRMWEDFIHLNARNSDNIHVSDKKSYTPLEGFAYPEEYEIVYESNNDSLPKILMIRESFGTAAMPFIAQNSSRSVFIFDAWQHKFNDAIFYNEKPDIYIQFVMEGFLRQMLRYSREERQSRSLQ
jgi:hypothetical protein